MAQVGLHLHHSLTPHPPTTGKTKYEIVPARVMASIYNPIPNNPFFSPQTNQISTPQGTLIVGSGLAVDPFNGTLLVASSYGGTVKWVRAGAGLNGGTITETGTINLLVATPSSLGGIKVGANLTVSPDGTLSALPPGLGTITGVTAGVGLLGGGNVGNVTLNLAAASTTQLGGVLVSSSGGITIAGGVISLGSATAAQIGGVRLASSTEVISGTDPNKVVTPATLSAKTATTSRQGLVQLSDNASLTSSVLAATPTAVKTAYTAAQAAQATANAALPKAGGTMTGVITFAPAQTFPGVAFPVATANSLGVISAGPGLSVNSSGVLSTVNNGTVTAVTAGPGLGTPASGGTIDTYGVLSLLPPTPDGIQLGGVKAGDNIQIDYDGTISVPGSNFIGSNNQYAYNSYIWPAPNAPGPGPIPLRPCPGLTGQVLTITDDYTGRLGWTSTGTLTTVQAGPGIVVSSTPTTATVSLEAPSSLVPGDFGATGLIPVLSVNQYGQVTSAGQANPYSPFLTATITVPPSLVLNFADNNLNWEWTLQGNATIQNPLNAQSGQTGSLRLVQNVSSPYVISWGAAWKFGNFTPYQMTSGLSSVSLIQFAVVRSDYIVVTNVIENIG